MPDRVKQSVPSLFVVHFLTRILKPKIITSLHSSSFSILAALELESDVPSQVIDCVYINRTSRDWPDLRSGDVSADFANDILIKRLSANLGWEVVESAIL
jgi:hypothetical protein